MKRLCIFIVVVIAQLGVFVEIHRTIHQKELIFLYVSLKQYAVTEGWSWDSESVFSFVRWISESASWEHLKEIRRHEEKETCSFPFWFLSLSVSPSEFTLAGKSLPVLFCFPILLEQFCHTLAKILRQPISPLSGLSVLLQGSRFSAPQLLSLFPSPWGWQPPPSLSISVLTLVLFCFFRTLLPASSVS